MVILSLLVGITISFYEEDATRAREDSARARLATFADSIKRWELEHRRTYPYDSLGPLVGKYIDNVGTDPWGGAFSVDTSRGYVYSWGPNGQDDKGNGDDVRYPFRTPTVDTLAGAFSGGKEVDNPETQRDKVYTPPSPPTQLTFDLGRQQIRWQAPRTFEDGTPLDPGSQLAGYKVYVRDPSGKDVLAPSGTIASASTTSFQVDMTNAGSTLYVVKAFYSDIKSAAIESKPSNQAGSFKPKTVAPVITRFEPTTYEPPLGNKNPRLKFHFEVFDADSNLTQVILDVPGVPGTPFTAWPPQGKTASQMPNRFQVTNAGYEPAGGFTLSTTGPISDVTLKAIDEKTPTPTTLKLALPIVVTNHAPTITSFRADRTAIIRGSSPETGYRTSVLVTVEAKDAEDNLSLLTLTRDGGPEPTASSTGGTVSRTFTVYTSGADVSFTAKAQDTAGASDVKKLQILIAADETPPETAVVSLNPSNPYLTAHPVRCETNDSKAQGVNNWYVTDPRNVTVTWTSFEAETPPVHYKVAISTSPPPLPPSALGSPTTSWTTRSVPDALTTGKDGWVTPRNDTAETYVVSVDKGEMTTTLQEGKRYYLAVQAANSANPPIVNKTASQPRNPGSNCLQNAFALDATPPDVGPVIVEAPLLCANVNHVISGLDGFSARWPYATDTTNGSGLSSYSYVLKSQSPIAGSGSQTLAEVQDFRASEINNLSIGGKKTAVICGNLIKDISAQHGNTLTLSVKAKDVAGNISTRASTVTVQVDSTPPCFIKRPVITNANNGVVTDPNHFEGRWDNTFIDNEESTMPLSFEWGISTTQPIRAIPDRSPGGWQQAGANIQGSFDQANLLANGDTVYLVVRATNCANSTSIETYSAPAIVRTGCFSRLAVTPSVGFQPLTVDFHLEIAGDATQVKGPFDFSIDFSDKNGDPETFSINGTNQTSVTASHTYSIIGNHRAFGEVTGAGGCKAFALATIQVLPQPYILVLGNSSLSVVDLAAASPVLAKFDLPSAALKASRLDIVEISDTLKFALFTAAGTGGALGGVFRYDLDSVGLTAVATEAAGDQIDDLSVSADAITVLLSNRLGGTRSLRRLRLDPGFNYKSRDNQDTPFSMGVEKPNDPVGAPSGIAVLADGKTGFSFDKNGGLFTSVFGLDQTPRVNAAQPVSITTPGYFHVSSDGQLLAVPDRASSRLLVAAPTATAKDSLGNPAYAMTTTTIVTLGGIVAGDVQISPDKKNAYAGEATAGHVVRVDLQTLAAAQTSVLANGPVAGLDVSRDSSLLVVGDSSGSGAVKLLKATTFEVLGTAGLVDGCRDVAFFEKPNFGKPVITSLLPKTVVHGGTVDARGFNLGPVDSSLQVSLISDSASVPTTTVPVVSPSASTNGFSSVRFVVPAGYASGGTTVVIATKQGSTVPSSAAKLGVQ
ncbi:MAG: hypothetical protein HY303_05620 [Candidatus Wallbacteria bacterium]|nr:hypothetical protein [Candidatus Wallbacteria bacterium]